MAKITKRAVDEAAAAYQSMLSKFGENNMATQRAEQTYREVKAAYEKQTGKAYGLLGRIW